MSVSPLLIEPLMCAVLRGEHPAWPDEGRDEALIDSFIRRGEYHGVQALLYERLHAAPGWPQDLLQALQRGTISGVMWELRHQQVVVEMLAALARIGIEPVLFKGTALAYSLYPDPALRTRGDTDFFVPPPTGRGRWTRSWSWASPGCSSSAS